MSLRWILNLTAASQQLVRWRFCFLEFHIDAVHRAGVRHQAADALSRVPSDGTNKTQLEDDLPVMVIRVENHDLHLSPLHMSEDISSTLKRFNVDQNKLQVPTLKKSIEARGKNTLRHQAAKQIGQSGSEFSLNKDIIIIGLALMDGALKKFVLQSLR